MHSYVGFVSQSISKFSFKLIIFYQTIVALRLCPMGIIASTELSSLRDYCPFKLTIFYQSIVVNTTGPLLIINQIGIEDEMGVFWEDFLSF